jgi:hypothetical protein
MLRREILDQVRWRPMRIREDVAFIDECEALGVPMLSADRFHFVRGRRNPREHTAAVAPTPASAIRLLPLAATAQDLEP